MTTDEKFNQIYQAIVDENADDMELARREAQVESRHFEIIFAVIVLINIALNYVFYKLTDSFSEKLGVLLIFISVLIFREIVRRGGTSKIEKYTMDFKTRIVGTMIKSFEEKLEFAPQYRITFSGI